MSDRARHWIAMLLLWTLPLQGLSAAVQRTAMPAHFHLHAFHPTAHPTAANLASQIHPLHDDDVLEYLGDRGSSGKDHAGIGYHQHPLGEAGVVYVADDGDGGSGTGTGKHVFAFDLLLPTWVMPALPALTTAIPSTIASGYTSHRLDRLDRPPR